MGPLYFLTKINFANEKHCQICCYINKYMGDMEPGDLDS